MGRLSKLGGLLGFIDGTSSIIITSSFFDLKKNTPNNAAAIAGIKKKIENTTHFHFFVPDELTLSASNTSSSSTKVAVTAKDSNVMTLALGNMAENLLESADILCISSLLSIVPFSLRVLVSISEGSGEGAASLLSTMSSLLGWLLEFGVFD